MSTETSEQLFAWPRARLVVGKIRQPAIDGHWKIDLYSSFKSLAGLKRYNDVYRRVARYVGEIASGVAAGKYETIGDVREELKRQRQREAMKGDVAK